MILTVTLNPALDRTINIKGFTKGRKNRVEGSSTTPGGKGINVSMALKLLGESSTALGLFGGGNGISLMGQLNLRGVNTEPVLIQGETRTNIKIISGNELTEINEQGPVVTDSNLKDFEKVIIKYAKPGNLFVFSGSLPQGVPDDTYFNLINLVKSEGAIAVLDCDGDALREGMKAVPYAVKLTLGELFEYKNEMFGGTIPDDYEEYVVKYSQEIIASGVRFVCVSMGGRGAYFTDGVNNMFSPAEIEEENLDPTVGVGDSMVAAMVFGIKNSLGFDETVSLTMKACSIPTVL